MFTPNLIGELYKKGGHDVHGRSHFGGAIECPFASVNLISASKKTSVRADSSASRGSADQIVSKRAKILIANYIDAKIGDKFRFDEISYLIHSVHDRRSVFGDVDHLECELEILPDD